tara:strand:- start:590 stop:973 length:384 start_codon:yes stop_codon:yes gene_type:complete
MRTQVLSLAMSGNKMALFAGGKFGMAVVMAVLITRGDGSAASLNLLNSGTVTGFSDGYLILRGSLLITLALSLSLPSKKREPAQSEVQTALKWVPDCSVPWAPGCEEEGARVAADSGDRTLVGVTPL